LQYRFPTQATDQFSYTQAIDSSSPGNLAFKQDVHRKRAFANLTAKLFTAAKDDALASCSEDVIDEKAYYCAGRAAYELGDYTKSKEFFENASKLNPKDSRYKKELKRANSRIKEQEEGMYDFDSMIASVNEQNVHLDHADWTKNTMIKSTLTRGRGLFAARDIEAGELVLCEKALCLPNRYDGEEGSDLIMYNLNTTSKTQRPAQTALFLQLVQKLYNNPHLNKNFFELDGGSYIRSGKEGSVVDGVPIVDT
jgi:tetratricopeptide (TPR) repeat protein